MKIVTLTLNPAFDLHCSMQSLAVGHENRADIISLDAGGKGINIARALAVASADYTALVVVGNENGKEFCESLAKDGLCYQAISTDGRIRENITLHPENAPETRISFSGFAVTGELLNRVEKEIDALCEPGSIVTLTGSNPPGLPIEDVKAFVKQLADKQISVVIDSRSFALADIIECAPFLIKPNEEEISAYLGREISDFAGAKEAANEWLDQGVQNVMISLGEKGAMLVCREGAFVADAPKICVVSTVGAGDSSIAGFLSAKAQGKSALDCLKTAVAFGTAACLKAGTQAPDQKDIQRFSGEIEVKRL